MIGNRRATVCLLAALGMLQGGTAHAEPTDATKLYREVLKSVVWIHSSRGPGGEATGTGTLVDRTQRLVLTNYHVVGDNESVTVLFPFYRNGQPVAEREFYTRRLRADGIRGRVLARDTRRDLALVRLASVPPEAAALPLAKEGASPGQSVHSIGNPGGSGALWVYTPGKVRQVYQKRWQARLDNRTATFEARVVETDSATNPGDSGGPLVNDQGQLIGVTQGLAVGVRLLSTFVDLGEVKAFLSRNTGFARAPEAAEPRKTPLTVFDEGRFFSPGAVEKANAAIAKLYRESRRDLLVETLAGLPEGEAAKVKAMSRAERDHYFGELTRERVLARQVDGVAIFVCREPSYLYVDVPPRSLAVFGNDDRKELIALLLSRFREKQYDEGLAAAVEFVTKRLAREPADP